ncbi:hypothetical protein KSF_064220 [Reticulibacter mediterranei]|uniref:Uncharacterized protein n=1 Tax=Reticulibacter mediterranei TaxID=2778369 RepID=A0A8J3IIZ1_9CHLR|nr:alpha/beta hydrolase family protein [Reticulibacter mediterranei]GHO96374.1 hypothetical protein KSF_064220 [Reticulibacter mediterranei]
MPTIQCPICQYRDVGPATTCANCGASLTLYRSNIEQNRAEDERLSSDTDKQQAIVPPKSSGGRSKHLPVVVPDHPEHGNNNLPVQRSQMSPTPYQNAGYGGQEQIFPTIPIKETKIFRLPEEFPRSIWLPRRRPDVTGIIIHVQSAQEFPDYPNLLRALVDLVTEFIWLVPNQPVHKEGERILVTTVRVRLQSGEKRDVRIQGNLRGANLSLGDMISFWCWKYRGSLMVRTGYNHTSKAIITTNAIAMFIPAIILLLILIAFLAAFFSWNHILPAIPGFFHK